MIPRRFRNALDKLSSRWRRSPSKQEAIADSTLPTATIVWPTREQADAGSRKLRECITKWQPHPGLYIEKPHTAVIVYLQDTAYDDQGFAIALTVSEVLMAPADFDPAQPLQVNCVWNQPYMSFNSRQIHAPYCFSLYFGSEGVRRLKESWAQLDGTPSELPMYLLRGSFNSREQD